MKESVMQKNKRQLMIDYLLHCVEEGDWHGVSDAANDLRVLEAKAEALNINFKGSRLRSCIEAFTPTPFFSSMIPARCNSRRARA